MTRLGERLLPLAGRYAHNGKYKWYDIVCYWILLITPVSWWMGKAKHRWIVEDGEQDG